MGVVSRRSDDESGAVSGVIGRALEVSSPAWPRLRRARQRHPAHSGVATNRGSCQRHWIAASRRANTTPTPIHLVSAGAVGNSVPHEDDDHGARACEGHWPRVLDPPDGELPEQHVAEGAAAHSGHDGEHDHTQPVHPGPDRHGATGEGEGDGADGFQQREGVIARDRHAASIAGRTDAGRAAAGDEADARVSTPGWCVSVGSVSSG